MLGSAMRADKSDIFIHDMWNVAWSWREVIPTMGSMLQVAALTTLMCMLVQHLQHIELKVVAFF